MSTARGPNAPLRLAQRVLLLRRFAYGESSLVLHALTPDFGRVALLAKGAYRPNSGFYAVFDLFDTLEVRWNVRSGQELGLVTRATLRSRRHALAGDLERYRAGLTLLELAHLTAREGHEERALFRWLEGWLDQLLEGRIAPALVSIAADLELLCANGLTPALRACASCGTPATERTGPVPFSAVRGGRLCGTCAAAERAGGRRVESLSLNVVRITASLMEATPSVLAHTRLEANMQLRVRALVERFLETHLETRPRSRPGAAPASLRP